MTEIPEHLLKRSKERRAALGGDDSAAADAASPSTATPAITASAAVAAAPATAKPAKAAPAAPPPPKPDPAYIAAAKSRKKIPFWAMATLSLLPIWGFMYVQGVKPQAKTAHGPLGDGVGVYSANCSTCHNPDGSGNLGRPFVGGASQQTFPHIEDQLNLVYTGSKAFADAGLPFYGDESLKHLGYNGAYMPKFGGTISDADILAAVCHERFDLGGVETDSPEWAEEYELWCSPESEVYLGLEEGTFTFKDVHEKVEGVLPVGTEPRPATPAGTE